MNYSSLTAMAEADTIRRIDADAMHALHLVALADSRPGHLSRVTRRLRGRGPRPSHVLEGEAAPRARLCDDFGPASV